MTSQSLPRQVGEVARRSFTRTLRQPGVLKRIEVVSAAHVDEDLPPVGVERLRPLEHVVDRAKRHVRHVPQAGRPLRRLRRGDDLLRAHPATHRPLDRLVEALGAVVVGHVGGDRRVSAGHDADQIGVLDENVADVPQDLPRTHRVAAKEVQVIDENDEQAP